ncbi:MAG: hypothetical protein ACLQO7_01785 [Candidatus Bathyarchaeia archaeon]
MSKQKAKKPPPYFYDGPPESAAEKEGETEDVYDTGERETMLEEDNITAAEEGFMKGHEQEPPAKKETRKKAVSHDDSISVELAKEDSEED